MTSPQIKIMITLAGISIIYAYVCEIRLSRKAARLANRLRKERPDLWSELNIVARNWNGGLPGLKYLYRRNVVDLPGFDREYGKLQALERKFHWAVGLGVACFCTLFAGFVFWGWHW